MRGVGTDTRRTVTAEEVGTTAASTLWPLLLLGLGGVSVLDIVRVATKLICPATI